MTMNYSGDILAAMDQSDKLRRRIEQGEKCLHLEYRLAVERKSELRREASTAFAALNGWKRTTASFAATMLLRGSWQRTWQEERRRGDIGSPRDHDYELFDHALFFRSAQRPYRPAAIVGQPYRTNIDLDAARALAAAMGLELHAPPNLTASWWYPGATLFYCFTRPGTAVRVSPRAARPAWRLRKMQPSNQVVDDHNHLIAVKALWSRYNQDLMRARIVADMAAARLPESEQNERELTLLRLMHKRMLAAKQAIAEVYGFASFAEMRATVKQGDNRVADHDR